jgi:AraC-like DNA-binding protein
MAMYILPSMQHVEFFHIDHFENNYHRVSPPASLSHLIDFFWETNFDHLWKQYPKGFSDALFPNIGYTYLINLGTPFIMQLENRNYEMRTDGFLPRHVCLECYHRPGNKIFGIKFKISPVMFEKKINFSEYREHIFPLSYLVDRSLLDRVKKVATFKERVRIVSNYYQLIVKRYDGSKEPIRMVTEILEHCFTHNEFALSVEFWAAKYHISTRSLQRYFETTTSTNTKKALQIMRIRKACLQLATYPKDFNYKDYGYYDHSHFYKHLKQFLQKETLRKLEPHLRLLEGLHQSVVNSR